VCVVFTEPITTPLLETDSCFRFRTRFQFSDLKIDCSLALTCSQFEKRRLFRARKTESGSKDGQRNGATCYACVYIHSKTMLECKIIVYSLRRGLFYDQCGVLERTYLKMFGTVDQISVVEVSTYTHMGH
jgi:hypothetical protein